MLIEILYKLTCDFIQVQRTIAFTLHILIKPNDSSSFRTIYIKISFKINKLKN